MEFYIPDIPAAASAKQIRSALNDAFRPYFIYVFDLEHWGSKKRGAYREARVTIHDAAIGEEFLRKYSRPEPRHVMRGTRLIKIHPQAAKQILIAGSSIKIMKSKNQYPPPEAVVGALGEENRKKAIALANRQPVEDKPYRHPFPFDRFECGVWTTDPRNRSSVTFSSFYESRRSGNFRLTRQAVQIEVFKEPGYGGGSPGQYMLFQNSTIRSAIISREASATYFIVTLRWCPRFYEKKIPGMSPTSPTYGSPLSPGGSPSRNWMNKARVSYLDDKHSKIAAYCFVYRFRLKEAHDAIRLGTITSCPGFLDVHEKKILYQGASYDFQRSMSTLDDQLATLPFDIAFQLQALVYNGILLPHRVKDILGVVREAIRAHRTEPDLISSILKSWVGSWEAQLPSDDPNLWLTENIISDFKMKLDKREQDERVKLQMKLYRKENHVMIHRVCITPTGMYLDGPCLEPKNRVIREYHAYLDNFVRVSFVDEDGGDIRFERGVDGKLIYDGRFLPCLMPDSSAVRIAGKTFTFLGFSQSSLRSHTAWFMAPIYSPKTGLTTVDTVIKGLGEFDSIRIPGKCAARIGQAFTDTVANIKIPDANIVNQRDVQKRGRNGKTYTFSDGCGTMSQELLDEILHKGEFPGEVKPTVFQIRFKGAKGVISLDSTLRDRVLHIRESMVKFKSVKHNVVEICRSFTKPLPFYLNRDIVKILEDRGIPRQRFIEIQEEALATLRSSTLSADGAAYFLEYQNRCINADVPFLIREITALNWNYQEDNFLRQVVEFTMLNTLRDMKYRARIQIEKGVTLVGILDETGYLQEGEIYCPVQEEEKPRMAYRGTVAICRNPALHPGDIQIVKAIEVPYDSPLRDLINCVVFSKRGERDLPSMLSGGDLDGDIFHIWWDKRIMPTTYAAPSDYNTAEPITLSRPVEQADIGKFFVDFMENDRLGPISTAHKVHADQQQQGVYSQECLRCAEMASNAVDFPKSGVPIKMSDLPRTNNARPDFLAPGPGVRFVSGKPTLSSNDEDYWDDEDLDGSINRILNHGSIVDSDDPFSTGRQWIYYKSPKALGHMYRAIDEQQFITSWESTASRHERGQHDLLAKVQEYMLRNVGLNEVYGCLDFALHLRRMYEQNIRDLSHEFSPSRHNIPLEEVEVFIGAVIGTESHRQTRLQKDRAEELKGQVNRLISQTMSRIRYGSEANVVEDGKQDGLTLERACACVMQSYTAREDGEGGKSFGWLAAAVGLKELSRRGGKKSTEDALAQTFSRLRF